MSKTLSVDNILDLIDNPPPYREVPHLMHPGGFARMMAARAAHEAAGLPPVLQADVHDCAWLRDLMAEPPSLIVGDWIDEPVDAAAWDEARRRCEP